MINLIFLKIFFINFCLFLSSLFGADVTYSSNTTLSSDLRLSLSQRAIINANLTLNGAGYFFQFPITSDQVLVVNNGYTATFQNILFNHFQNANLSLGTGSSIVLGSGCVLNCIVDQTLTNVYNVSGPTTILGNGTTIHLGNGAFSVSAGGSLTLENVTLTGVSTANLLCVDNTGTIKFSNVTISIPNRWQWSNGAFSIDKYLRIKDGIFAYTSGMSSTILSASELVMSNSLNFSYDPIKLSGQAVASQTNLVFSDTSSWLILNGGVNLFVTNTGLKLLKGSLNITGQNYLYSDAISTITSQGLILGNGSFASDFNVTNFASLDSGLYVKKGLISYNNEEIRPLPTLKWGDHFILQHKTFGYFLAFGSYGSGADTYTYPSAPSGRLVGGLLTPDVRTLFRFAPLFPANGTTDSSKMGTVYQSGGGNFSPPDSTSNMENINEKNLGGPKPRLNLTDYWLYSQPPAPVSTPNPPYYPVFGDGGIHYGANIVATKKVVNITTSMANWGISIQEGDTVYIHVQGNDNFRWRRLYGTNNTFISGGVTYREIIGYLDAASSASYLPNDGNDEWIVYQIISQS